MGFIKTVILIAVIGTIIGLVAYDPTREYLKGVCIYTIAPAATQGYLSIVQSEWWQMYQLAIVVPPAFILGIFLTAMYYKGKIKMWQWGAKKAVETAYGSKQPAPAPTPLATAPLILEEKKEVAA